MYLKPQIIGINNWLKRLEFRHRRALKIHTILSKDELCLDQTFTSELMAPVTLILFITGGKDFFADTLLFCKLT